MAFYKGNPDIIIRNGTIVDGTGRPRFYADIAIEGDKIAYIGSLKGVTAPKEIDATGKFVTPGFIDVHSHADYTIWGNPECYSNLYQGVTTEVVGNCGFSMRMSEVEFDPAGDGIDCVYNLPGPTYPKGSVAATLDKMDKMGASMNTAWLCGHNDLRVMAQCYTPEYTEEQFQIMADFLREAMEAGYIGFSTGLEFVPGIVSKPEEVERLAQIAAEYDGIYTSHMRDEGTYLFEAIEEFLNVIRKTGMRGSISHLNVKYDNGIPNEYLQKSMQMVKDARNNEHLNVYCDMLSTTFATGGALAMLPPWLYENGWDEAKKILADPEGRQRVKKDFNRYWRFLDAGQWDRLLYIMPEYLPEVAATPFMELVEKSGKEPIDVFLDVMMQAPTMTDAMTTHIQGTVFHEQTLIDTVINDPIYLWQGDNRTSAEHEPFKTIANDIRYFMSMLYFFTRYVKELEVISLEDAVKKVGSMAAHHFRLEKRGSLEVGNYADINVFALEDLKINATFQNPTQYCSGMDYVIVNGTPVIVEGKHTGSRPGRVLRHK